MNMFSSLSVSVSITLTVFMGTTPRCVSMESTCSWPIAMDTACTCNSVEPTEDKLLYADILCKTKGSDCPHNNVCTSKTSYFFREEVI